MTHLVDVLAVQLSNQLLDPGGVDLGTGSLEDSGNVFSLGGGLSTELGEEVGSNVLHSVVQVGLSVGLSLSCQVGRVELIRTCKGLVNQFKP